MWAALIQVSTQLWHVALPHCTWASHWDQCCLLCPLQVVKMKTTQVISLTLLFVLTASAQVLKFGRCPKPAVQANFDATRVKEHRLTVAATETTADSYRSVWNLVICDSILASGTRSWSCQQPSRKVSAVLPPTVWRALVLSESSTVSCCE